MIKLSGPVPTINTAYNYHKAVYANQAPTVKNTTITAKWGKDQLVTKVVPGKLTPAQAQQYVLSNLGAFFTQVK